MKKKVEQEIVFKRYETTKEKGLSTKQVNERIEQGLVNNTKIKSSHSYLSIVVRNLCTFFNFLWLLIAIALLSVGAYSDMLFLIVIVINTAVAIVQEINAKRTVDKLSLMTAPKVRVIRGGEEIEILSEELLLDDIIYLENGNQIPADCVVIDGKIEVNESLLTGESKAIKKTINDELLGGSFLVSGSCYARVDKVGKDCYVQQLTQSAKEFKAPSSNLNRDLKKLIYWIAVILIPFGIMTFIKEYVFLVRDIPDAIKSTSGALVGMIPAGMFLLITIGLSIGVIKLAKKKTLVKDLYSIEMLARTNILCLDKTGTITDGTMNVVEVLKVGKNKIDDVEKIMASILASQTTENATGIALVKRFGKESNLTPSQVIEFSSDRKYMATEFMDKTYYVGAPTYVNAKLTPAQEKKKEEYLNKGYRVLALVECEHKYREKKIEGKTLALIVLEDHIRENAIETIKWFKENKVQIKIISGDDPLTVSKIAERVGVDNSDKYVSLEGMSLQEVEQIADKITVFGRVSPEQKHTIVKTLKNKGNVVAMTGDGVNDTLALKEADCSIAMADGSEAARNISKLVLMDSNFTSLPSVVKEGRQVINNVQNSSSLFLMKTLLAISLCLFTIILQVPYLFDTKQMFILEMFVIGLPSLILTLQENSDPIEGNFIPQVLKRSAPRAALLLINCMILVYINSTLGIDKIGGFITENEYITLSTLVLTFTGFFNLMWLCFDKPTKLKFLALVSSLVLIIASILIMPGFFKMTEFTSNILYLFGYIMIFTLIMIIIINLVKIWIKMFKSIKKDVKTEA
jgi:cation-transporting ATPase E